MLLQRNTLNIPRGGFSVNGRTKWVWSPALGLWQQLPLAARGVSVPARKGGGGSIARLGTVGDSAWCDQASPLNPLAYVLCLPSDVQKVYSAATSSFPAPPAAAPPGAPQTVAQMTTPGAFTPTDSAVATQQTSLADWNTFFGQVAAANNAPSTAPCSSFFSFLDSACNPSWWIPLAAVAAFGFLVMTKGRR